MLRGGLYHVWETEMHGNSCSMLASEMQDQVVCNWDRFDMEFTESATNK